MPSSWMCAKMGFIQEL